MIVVSWHSARSRHLALRRSVFGLAVLGGLLVVTAASAQPARDRVLVTRVTGAITPVYASHLSDGLERAGREGYAAYLIRMDTPGGLDVAMRDIVQSILASEVPVIVYVSPQGARGASAGAVIAYAAHVAAMAPGTAIGAATPVSGDGSGDLDDKVINDAAAYVAALAELRGRNVDFAVDTVRDGRSASAREALEEGAIDIVAGSVDELLEAIDGTTVMVARDREVNLSTADAILEDHEMGFFRSVQQRLADPNIAFLLLSIGTLGLIYELASPGIGVGGALGLTFLLLALVGLAVLPVDVVGVLFLLLAAAMFVAEVLAPGVGLAAAGGVLSLVLSGVFLFDDTPGLELSMAVALPAAIVIGGFVIIAGRVALRARRAPSTSTGEGLYVGWRGPVRVRGGEPQVFLQGAWWQVRLAEREQAIDDGAEVEVVAMDGLQLVVVSRSTPTGVGPDQEGTT